MSLIEKLDHNRLPAHIAIIMDGNGRWAKARGLDRSEGHKEGVEAIRRVVKAASATSVKYLTIYAFSTENWRRPADEVSGLMDLMVYALTRETAELKKNGVRIVAIGNVERLPVNVREILQECIQETAGGRRLTVVIALSYSSKWELTEAVRKISDDIEAGILQKEDISEDTICNYLTTHDLPDPDLLIRTGGEQRISNFLLWQSAYAEFYFTETYWPDFNDEELYKAIVDYQKRERRFGKISEQIEPEQ